MLRPVKDETSRTYELTATLHDDLTWRWEDGLPSGVDPVIPRDVVAACRLWAMPGSTLELTIGVRVETETEPSDITNPPHTEVSTSCYDMLAMVASRDLESHLGCDVIRSIGGSPERALWQWKDVMWEYLKDLFIMEDAADRVAVGL